MGADDEFAYPQDFEGPVRDASVPPFAIGATTVTVAEFAASVEETGFETDAQKHGDSMVFHSAVAGGTWPAVAAAPWWLVVAGACWHHPRGPEGPDARVELPSHPVTQVSHNDALAYCAWSGTRLPSEKEWEFAARGGREGDPFPWGAELMPDGEHLMNVWQGEFPVHNSIEDGFEFTAPVGSYPPNGYGLLEMTGNVWEWTDSVFAPQRGNVDPVLRGGSHLCHESYCRRYRVSARSAASRETSTGHIGFRVARSISAK